MRRTKVGIKFVLAAFGMAGIANAIAEGFLTSDWSEPRNGMSIRVSCPAVIEASRDELDFFVKCELRNTSASQTTGSVQRARLYLVDSLGRRYKCLRHLVGIYEAPGLAPGASAAWWQHGIGQQEGTFRLQAHWDGDDEVRSPAISVTVRRSRRGNDYVDVVSQLQKEVGKAVEIVPNTRLDSLSYTKITFTNDPVIVSGRIFNPIRFAVPKDGGDLVFSYVVVDMATNDIAWSLVPTSGLFRGSVELLAPPMRVLRDVEGIAKKGDCACFLFASGSQMKAGEEYILGFECPSRDIPTLRVSLNILRAESVCASDIFAEIYQRGL